ncbi:MAG: tetratricopeptide repeat protein [Muribaculaceae bacterium]|nr:tetratricopeptide repeat protein [Muribaculaceae bacterium]
MVVLLASWCAAMAQLSSTDRQQLEYAMFFMDNGMIDKAIEILEDLTKKNPNDMDVAYEHAYAYYLNQDYERAAKLFAEMEKRPDINEQSYQMHGNALDMLGKRKEAIKTYEKGIKRFPNSYLLPLEMGVISFGQGDYMKALEWYEKSIEAAPNRAAGAYARAAELLLGSNMKEWGLFYGEVLRLIEPNSKRSKAMGQRLYDAYRSYISIKNDSAVQVNLIYGNNIYDLGHAMALAADTKIQNGKLSVTLAGIINARKSALAIYEERGHEAGEVSLLDFQRQVLNAGHWDAYNVWLLSCDSVSEETAQWLSVNEDRMDDFIDWYNDHQFTSSTQALTHRLLSMRQPAPIDVPDSKALENEDSCKQYDSKALECARYWLQSPNSRRKSKTDAAKFMLKWAGHSPTHQLQITQLMGDISSSPSGEDNGDDKAEMGQFFVACLAAEIIELFEAGKTTMDADLYYRAISRALDYYEANPGMMNMNESLRKCLDARSQDTLRTLTNEDWNMLPNASAAQTSATSGSN